MKRIFLLIANALLFSVVAQSQTVKWCINPEYDEIIYFSEDLFKCVEPSGRVHLINKNGNTLLHHVDADAVTDFKEGYAIVLKGNKILGFLEETQGHNFQSVTGEYSITQYPFFSEGLLAVADSKGKMGYMDTRGNIVIPCKYESVRPFKQGWASVEVGKKNVYYINLQGKTRNPEGFHGGKLTKGSSFNENGEAVVANYQDYAVIGTNMQVKRKIEYTSELPVRSCDYAYSKDAENGCREKSILELDENGEIEAYSKNGAYGYQWKNGEERDRLPAQFSEAQPFIGERAIVAKNRRYGVIELVEGKFSASWPKELRVYPDGKYGRIQFSMGVPSSFESDKVELEFDRGNGNYQKNIPFEYDFQPDLHKGARKCALRGKVTYDGLVLWEGMEDVKVEAVTINISAPATTTEVADENDNQTVKTTITNTSNVDVMVEATLKVAGQTAPFKGTLKPKQSKALSVTIKVTETQSVSAAVSVKADGHDCGSKASTVSLKI